MRLLDAKRLELVDVRGDAIPPYAILSHTWGDEEITLQELRHMRGRMPQSLDKRKRTIADKEGFAKVKDAAALAVNRGFSYIWVDTCCIDKSSSAELSEAINSMYLWYQQAAECYAFLSDVKPANEEDWSKPNSSLLRSRWFTRGWTLQELIAPKSVHFYAKDWSFLGHKDGPDAFMRIISEVTGIDVEVLDGRIDPLQLSISARMKWASRRHTTRLEDTAYSLIGLFQVNMPLLYGEGHRAFTRLQEEIIQRSDDQSLYAWNSLETTDEDPDELSGLLAHSPEQFKDTGNIQPLPPSPVYASAPSGMTNHGLRVQLYLRPLLEAEGVPMEEDYDAILDCFISLGDLYQCPVIRLRRLSQDQYARLQTKSRKYLPPPQGEFPEYEGYRTIYVRQQPVYYNLPQFRVSPIHIHSNVPSQQNQQYKLTEIFPPRQWNSTTMTMKVKYSRKLQAMGVFRFQSSSALDKTVDVVVGLRRLDAMQWEGWCFQRACQGNSLEYTLSVINQKVSELTRTKIVSSGMLRESLGEDSNLMTDATVEGMQLQGRLYISISMSQKPEVHSPTQLHVSSKQQGSALPAKESPITISLLHDFQVRTLTGPCSRSYLGMKSPFYDDVEPKSEPLAVRGRPRAFSGSLGGEHIFRGSLLVFMQRVHNQKTAADPKLAVSLEDQLAIALFKGDQTEIERLLAVGVDLDTFTSDLHGFAPLHWAVTGCSMLSVSLLLGKNVSPLSLTREGWTILHISAVLNRSFWKAALGSRHSDEGANELANKRTRDHLETALHLAAAYCPNTKYGVSHFRELLGDGATLFARNKHDETPLHRAAAFNNSSIIQSIINWKAQSKPDFIDIVDRYGRSPLWHAAATGSCDAIRVLLSFNASINLTDDLGRSPLHAACRGGYHDAVEMLLQEGARQSTQTSLLSLTALDYAAMFGHVECLQHLLNLRPMNALLASQPETVASQNRSLHIAASCGWLKCVELLCDTGADPSQSFEYYLKLDDSKTCAIVVKEIGDALSGAAKEGHVEIVKYFETSVTSKEHRHRKGYGYFGQPPKIQAQEPDNQSVTTVATDQDSLNFGQEHRPIAAPQQSAYQGAQRLSVGFSNPGLQRYTLTETYEDSLISPTAPLTDLPLRIGSHSATVPAYSSPAYSGPGYPQPSYESNTQYHQVPQLSPYPSLPYGQSPSPYPTAQTPYGSQTFRRPHSYASINRPSLSIPYSADTRYPPPVPTIPASYSSAPRPPSPKDNQEPPSELRANLHRMLGKLGDPGLLTAEVPTPPELLHHDQFSNCLVYQNLLNIDEETSSDNLDRISLNGFPVFELATVSESKSRGVLSESRTGRGIASPEAVALLEADRAANRNHEMASSVYDFGSWRVWPALA